MEQEYIGTKNTPAPDYQAMQSIVAVPIIVLNICHSGLHFGHTKGALKFKLLFTYQLKSKHFLKEEFCLYMIMRMDQLQAWSQTYSFIKTIYSDVVYKRNYMNCFSPGVLMIFKDVVLSRINLLTNVNIYFKFIPYIVYLIHTL